MRVLVILLSCLVFLFPVVALCADVSDLPEGAEGRSLLGEALYPPELPPEMQADRTEKLAMAREIYEQAPEDVEAIIWVGRRTAYLGRYREAIGIYTSGIELHPEDARLYRHRGHRFISVRELDRAISDLERAASIIKGTKDVVEPDGLPNDRNIPTSTLHTNIWYHLGLAYYLQGRFEEAARAYASCREASKNPDMLSATVNWEWHALMRLDRTDKARAALDLIHADMDIIENEGYLRLCLLYKGELAPDDLLTGDEDPLQNATLGYGLSNWYLVTGHSEKAETAWTTILKGPQWAAFGFIAAEAELARLTPEIPFHMPTPDGWREETIPFPLSFAPELEYSGVEVLRFAPGMFESDSEDYWTYAFVWWLKGDVPIDSESLEDGLEEYFEGLSKAVAESGEFDLPDLPVKIELSESRESATRLFRGTAETIDVFVTRESVTLNIRVEILICPTRDVTVVFFELSPRPAQHEVWKTLAGIRMDFQCQGQD